jgi:hypothetical protein
VPAARDLFELPLPPPVAWIPVALAVISARPVISLLSAAQALRPDG